MIVLDLAAKARRLLAGLMFRLGIIRSIFRKKQGVQTWKTKGTHRFLYPFLLFGPHEQVGLAVEPDWYNVILNKFQALLDRMEESDMPETAQYRIDVTKWCNYVMETARANPDDPEAVEDAVNMGQVEELIEMAGDEMIALETYLRVRMWELVEDMGGASVDFNPDPMKDPFAEGGDPDVAEKLRKGMEAKEEKK